MNLKQITGDELVPFVGLITVIIAVLIYNYLKGARQFWSPLTIIAIVYGYYCCIGPYEAVVSGSTVDRLIQMRKYYPIAFWGALVSLLSYILGFILHGESYHQQVPTFSKEALFEYGRKIFLTGFILFTISTGGNVTKLINPLDAEYVQQVGGAFGNYLALTINFLISGVALLFTYFLVSKKKMIWFLIPFLVTTGIFLTLGFRYRLVLLLAALLMVFYLFRGKRPNPVYMFYGFTALIIVMGVVNKSRTYGGGLNVKKLEHLTQTDAYNNGLEESRIFQTSGAILDVVPSKYPYMGFEPLWSTLLFPIPSAILPNKNSADYMFGALTVIYGKVNRQGAAFMAFAEYYLAFGWVGLVAGCMISGFLLRKFWNWFQANSGHPFAIAVYSASIPYLYVVLSRGYMPQVTMLFIFTVIPIHVAFNAAKKKYGNRLIT